MKREQAALEQCLEKTAPFEALARSVTFANFLFKRSVPGLTDDVMAMELPNVVVAPAPVSPEASGSP